ncbi:MAG: FliM/FliN family flagellar motor switch protein [Planctomycetota bacterium]|jgi:flagellar motor switch protein FliN/FliY
MPAGIDSILALEVPVIVQIAERMMPVEDVVSMTPGAIIELPKSSNEDLEILVNNKIIGMGTAVKVGENFGVRVSYIGDLSHRLSAMGGGAEQAVPEPAPGEEPDGEEPGPDS